MQFSENYEKLRNALKNPDANKTYKSLSKDSLFCIVKDRSNFVASSQLCFATNSIIGPISLSYRLYEVEHMFGIFRHCRYLLTDVYPNPECVCTVPVQKSHR